MAINYLFSWLSVNLSSAASDINWRIGAILMTLTLLVFFSKASKAQFENQTIQAKESEAIGYIWAMNRVQQAYYAEAGNFTDSISKLEEGIKIQSVNYNSQTVNYNYSISKGNNSVFNYAIARATNLKSFVGGVFLVDNVTQTILCQANVAGTTQPANPINNNGVLACGANTEEVRNSPLRSQAEQSVSSMNRAQQAYYAENGSFADSLAKLGIGIRVQNPNYNYSIRLSNEAVFNYGIARESDLYSYVGGVFLVRDVYNEIIITKTILCVANVPGTVQPTNPINTNGVLECGVNTTEVSNLPNAKQLVSSMNRAQQAYYAENDSFADAVEKLGVGIRVQNPDYNYLIRLSNKAVFNYAIARKSGLYSYVGGVFLVGDVDTQLAMTTILCVANVPGTDQPANPTNNNGVLACGINTMKVSN